jgi:hypothetical protein
VPKLIALVLSLLTFGSSGVASAQTPETGRELWTVTGEQPIEVAGRPASISPDGNWLAGEGDNYDFCIWSLPDLEAFCDGENVRPEAASIAWAPDSSAVAFSQDAARYFIDSDITVFDVETKQLTNLTDVPGESQDPVFTSSGEDGDFIADVMPVWTADGSTILFVRGVMGDSVYNTNIMSVDVETGDVAPYFVVSPTFFLSVFTPMFLLPDGSLLISINHPETENQQNGIWRIGPGGSRIDRAFEGPNEAWSYGVTITDVSSDGSTALLTTYFANPGDSPYGLLDLETGTLEPFPDPDADESWTSIPTSPKFIGDSSEIVYPVTVPDSDLAGLSVGQVDPYALFETEDSSLVVAGLDISANGKIFLPGEGTTSLVLTLESTLDDDATPVPPCGCTPPPIG